MTHQQHKIGSLAWLNAMRRDYNLNGVAHPTHTKTQHIEPQEDLRAVVNQAAFLRERAAALEELARDLQQRLLLGG